MVINAWSRYFVELLSRPVCQLTILFHAFLDMPFHIVRPRRNTKIFRAWKFFSSTRGSSRFKRGSAIVINIFACFTLSLSAIQVYMIKERCGFSQVNFFIELFPTNFVSSAHTVKNNLFFTLCKVQHSQVRTVSKIIFLNCRSYNSLAKRIRTDFVQEEQWGLPYWTMSWGHLSRGRRILMSGHSDFEILRNFGESSILTYVFSCLSCASN